MRVGGLPHVMSVGIALMVMLSSGCAIPASPSATPSAEGGPPLASDLAGGVPVELGGVGHWVIRDGRAITATDDGIEAIDLGTGKVTWRASFGGSGEPWDATATVGLSADGTTAHALRTVTTPDGSALELLSVTASTGAVAGDRALADPDGLWHVDLPPRILAADAATLVLADDPEVGRQVGAVDLSTGTVVWSADDQGFAGIDPVITRSGARDPLTGASRWETAFQIGPFLGRADDRVVVGDTDGARVVWLDIADGEEAAATAEDPDSCAPADSVLVCLGEEASGYDLTSGEPLWSGDSAEAVTTYRDWVYLWHSETRGDVLDGRTGEVLVTDAELPRIRYSDATGVLVDSDTLRWVVTG